MEELIIKIDWTYFLGMMGGIILVAWYSSGRFTKIETTLDSIEKRMTGLEGRSNATLQAQSPVSLTEKGTMILEESGLKDYIDEHKDDFSSKCKFEKDLMSAYDVQEASFDCLNKFTFDSPLDSKLKECAFQHGVDVAVIRRIGGIYLRNLLLEDLGMKEKDVDLT